MGKSSKGSSFEREISKQLSLWWTKGASDSVFWRSAMSGGRATVRAKVGKNTNYMAGDICAIDPIGAPLIESTVIELKRGYSKWCVLDLIDGKDPKKATLGQFLTQVEEECKQAKVKNFLLICKRDGRCPIVVLPIYMVQFLKWDRPEVNWPITYDTVAIVPLSQLLALPPEEYLKYAKEHNGVKDDSI